MTRTILDSAKVHPAIAEKLATYKSDLIDEAKALVAQHAVVILGMSQNPFPKKARRLLDSEGVAYHYAEWGSYVSRWHDRLAIKLWTGWPTFPQVFVHGVLVGGFSDLKALVDSGELKQLLSQGRQ